jgi:hypothetical protein
MAIPAFLIPALTGFAISKLTGQSTKKALQSALLGAAVGGSLKDLVLLTKLQKQAQ